MKNFIVRASVHYSSISVQHSTPRNIPLIGYNSTKHTAVRPAGALSVIFTDMTRFLPTGFLEFGELFASGSGEMQLSLAR